MKKLLVTIILGMSFSSAFGANTCSNLFLNALNKNARQIQRQIFTREKSYPHFTSNYRGGDYELKDMPLANAAGTAIISFGSGPDIFTPIIDFPLAREYHLVDSMQGWGKGPEEVIDELYNRMVYIHPTANVELVSAKGENPLTFELTWTDEKSGPATRFIFLHVMNYDVNESFDSLMSKIKIPLGGIVITGAPVPLRISEMTARLKHGGAFVFEDYFDETDAPDKESSMVSTLSPLFMVKQYPKEKYRNNTRYSQKILFIKK